MVLNQRLAHIGEVTDERCPDCNGLLAARRTGTDANYEIQKFCTICVFNSFMTVSNHGGATFHGLDLTPTDDTP